MKFDVAVEEELNFQDEYSVPKKCKKFARCGRFLFITDIFPLPLKLCNCTIKLLEYVPRKFSLKYNYYTNAKVQFVKFTVFKFKKNFPLIMPDFTNFPWNLYLI